MNRRTFFSSILGVPVALAAAAAHEARSKDPLVMLECVGGHTPAPGYGVSGFPLTLYTPQETCGRALVPCARCGAMFGLRR